MRSTAPARRFARGRAGARDAGSRANPSSRSIENVASETGIISGLACCRRRSMYCRRQDLQFGSTPEMHGSTPSRVSISLNCSLFGKGKSTTCTLRVDDQRWHRFEAEEAEGEGEGNAEAMLREAVAAAMDDWRGAASGPSLDIESLTANG